MARPEGALVSSGEKVGSGLTQLVVAVGAGVVALGAAVWFGRGPAPEPPPAPVVVEEAPARVEQVTVHVSGAVARPGLVRVPSDARVADVIAAAGGILPAGDPAGINLAGPVADGQHIVVPGEGSGGLTGSGSGTRDGLVHLNTATAEQLTTLPGIGPVLAERIVRHREANGPFRAIEDLLDVPGIGEGKLAGLRDVAAP